VPNDEDEPRKWVDNGKKINSASNNAKKYTNTCMAHTFIAQLLMLRLRQPYSGIHSENILQVRLSLYFIRKM
jgi:hypothetical protein